MRIVDIFKVAIPSTLWRDENPERNARWHWPNCPEATLVQKISVQEAVKLSTAVPATATPAVAVPATAVPATA
eukprot:2367848-Lingulodinium_polyedra.AAC.1